MGCNCEGYRKGLSHDVGGIPVDCAQSNHCSLNNNTILLASLFLFLLCCQIIAEFTERLAPYQFLTAFSQLISRICHSHTEVSLQLQVSKQFPLIWQHFIVHVCNHCKSQVNFINAMNEKHFQLKPKYCFDKQWKKKSLMGFVYRFFMNSKSLVNCFVWNPQYSERFANNKIHHPHNILP